MFTALEKITALKLAFLNSVQYIVTDNSPRDTTAQHGHVKAASVSKKIFIYVLTLFPIQSLQTPLIPPNHF